MSENNQQTSQDLSDGQKQTLGAMTTPELCAATQELLGYMEKFFLGELARKGIAPGSPVWVNQTWTAQLAKFEGISVHVGQEHGVAFVRIKAHCVTSFNLHGTFEQTPFTSTEASVGDCRTANTPLCNRLEVDIDQIAPFTDEASAMHCTPEERMTLERVGAMIARLV